MNEKMPKTETVKRYILSIAGLFVSALGVALSKKAGLGVSPISSVANVLSMKFVSLSLGSWLIIWNCVLILGQILLLRKNFKWIQLLQIPLSFLFGWFTDFGVWLASFIGGDSYIISMALVLAGTVVMAFGISLCVNANVVMNSGEAFVKAVSDVTGLQFGNVKTGFDVCCVIIAVVLSLLFFNFTIQGTREGTVIAAVLTGFVIKFFNRLLGKPLGKILAGNKNVR